MKWDNLVAAVFLVLVLASIGLGVYYVQRETSLVGRAKEGPGTYSLENSYVFASPLTARANGQERIRVTVFLLSDKGLGVPKKIINLTVQSPTQGASVQVEILQGETDDRGQAIFEVLTTVAGRYQVFSQVEGKTFPQTVYINFE